MNTYRDNLRDSVVKSLIDISSEQAKRSNEKKIAEQDLYYAIGSQTIAQAKFGEVDGQYDKELIVSEQGDACGNRANNLLNTATTAADGGAKLINNSATVAQNVQVAANAISKLAAKMGSATSIAFATVQGTDLDDKVNTANTQIRRMASAAEQAALCAMQASSEAAQIIAPQVLAETISTQAKFNEIQQKTASGLAKLTEDRTTAQQSLTQALSQVITHDGKCQDVTQLVEATKRSYASSNKNLNYNLQVNADSAGLYKVEVSFDNFTEDNLPEDKAKGTDNFRVKCYIAKITKNRAIANGIST